MRLAHFWLVMLIASVTLLLAPGCGEDASPAPSPATTESSHDEHDHDHEGHDHAEHDHEGHDHAHDGDTDVEDAPAVAPVTAREAGPLRVVTSIPTLKWPIYTLISPDDELESILAPGQSVHGFELTPAHIELIDNADILVLVGLGLDEPVARAARNRPSAHRQVLVLADIADDAGQLPSGLEHHDHDHDHDGEGHAHADPHIWLIPDIMAIYASEVGSALQRAYTALGRWQGEDMERVLQETGNAADSASIAGLTFATRLEPFFGQGVVSNHAAFGVFLEHFGMEEFAVLQPDPSVEPAPGDVQRVVDAIREHDLKAILVVPWHNRSAAERAAEMTGVPLVEVDPIGDGDWPLLMQQWYEKLYEALTGAPPALEQ